MTGPGHELTRVSQLPQRDGAAHARASWLKSDRPGRAGRILATRERWWAYAARAAGVVAFGCGALATPCLGAEEQGPPPVGGTLTDVIVTGSRIAVPNDVAISPVVSISANTIEQSGVTRIEDLLNSLPQVVAAQGSTVSNSASGTAEVNLRGLGVQRTLVLVNGRRLGPGTPDGGSQSDLNQIPAELIDSVEILTGGASSVYGADAVAGVVNFKLLDHFEGVKLSGNYSLYDHSNRNSEGVIDSINTWNAANGANYALAPGRVSPGATKDLSLLAGLDAPDGRGNLTLYANYRSEAAVLQSKYSYSACTLAPGYLAGPNATGGAYQCAGSYTAYPGSFRQFDPVTGDWLGGLQTIASNGTLVPFTNANLYNYGPFNYFQRPDERYSGGAFAHYSFAESANAYAELQYMSDRTLAQVGPSGVFFGGSPYAINCSNPELSASMLAGWCGGGTSGDALLFIGRRNVEGGGRRDHLEHGASRVVLGVEGKLDAAWQYDLSGQYGSVNYSEASYNEMSTLRIANALRVVDYNAAAGTIGAGGVPTCTTALPASFANLYPEAGSDSSCVPWNIFQLGGPNSRASSNLAAMLASRGNVTQEVVSTNFTGDLGHYGLQLPTASSGVKVNLGAEWREVRSTFIPSLEYQNGDAEGVGFLTLPVAGEIVSRELFTEMHLPLIADRRLAKSLNFDSGYRYSAYADGPTTSTYKFGVEWGPVRELRLRGSWSRAVRAPDIYERFTHRSIGADGVIDPCAGTTPQFSLAECERSGVTPAEYGNITPSALGAYNGLTGGNPQLQPETATTVSFGVGWTPMAVAGLRLQLDYYDIRLLRVIETIGADTILRQCLLTGLFCNLVQRDQFGSLWLTPRGYIVDTEANVGKLEQKGIDVDVGYAVGLGRYGKLRTSLIGTYLFSYVTASIAALSSTSFDCRGYYGPYCGQPTFKWRHTVRGTWETPWHGFEVSLAWRYFDSVTLDALSSNPNLAAPAGNSVANGGISNTDARLSSRGYLDLSAALRPTPTLTVRVGISNLFDKDPPVVGNADGASNGNTFPEIYDSTGRYVFATITARY